MKKIGLLLITILFYSTAAFAGDSYLQVSLYDDGDFRIMLDNSEMSSPGNVAEFDNLSAGEHYLKIMRESANVPLQRGQYRRSSVEEDEAARVAHGPPHPKGGADQPGRVLRQSTEVRPWPHDSTGRPDLGQADGRRAWQLRLDARDQHRAADAAVQRGDMARS